MGSQDHPADSTPGQRHSYSSWAVGALCAAALPLGLACDSYGSRCGSFLSAAPDISASTHTVRGRIPVSVPLQVRESSSILVSVAERGIDVSVEITDAAGHLLARGDNPVRRTGVQRIEFAASARGDYSIVLTGKEHEGAQGEVAVRVESLNRSAPPVCLNALRLLARGDAAYANGQAVTHGRSDAPGMSAESEYAQAAARYRQAAGSLATGGPSPLLAQAQQAEAAVEYQDVQSWTATQEWALSAAATFTALHDDYGRARATALEAAALLEIAVSSGSSSTITAGPARTLEQARALLRSVADYHHGQQQRYDEALALNNIGISYYFEGRYEEAIGAYQQSVPLYEGLGERPRLAQALQNIALAEYELGRIPQAAAHYARVLELIRRDDNPTLYAVVLNNSALTDWAGGREDLALRQYAQSLALAKSIQDAYEQAVALHGIASVYNTLGDQSRALAFYQEALALRSSSLDARGRTASLRAIANLLRQQGEPAEALRMDREAFDLASAPTAKMRISVQMARDLADLGRTEQALRQIDSVLAQQVPGSAVERARALVERARHRAAGDVPGGEADLHAAIDTFRAYEAPAEEFAAWVALGRLLRYHDPAAAFAAVDRALALAEEVRLQSANPELRSTLLQPLRPAFDLKISMLADQFDAAGTPAARQAAALSALMTSEQARARSLADFENLDVSAPGLDPSLASQRRELYREIAARRLRLEAALDRSGTDDTRSRAIRAEIAGLRRNLDQIDAQIGAASYAAHRSAPGTTVPRWQATALPVDVAVIEYWLGADEAYAWVRSGRTLTMTRLGSSARINTEALAFHTALRKFGAVKVQDRLDAALRLSETVLAPIRDAIGPARTLIFVADGALHYVPFAALRDTAPAGRPFLVETHDVAVTPSMEMLMRPQAPRNADAPVRRMLLVDDPVYEADDPRFSRAAVNLARTAAVGAPVTEPLRGGTDNLKLPRLPGTAQEAAAIAALLPAADTDRLDGFQATRERFLDAPLHTYRFIHVASHANTDAEIPQASALILSTMDRGGATVDGRVLAADFMTVRLQADAVVLSACDTALGKSVAGEGLVGLRYVVLARGARSVVSSLWPVSDRITAGLMVRFYSVLLRPHASVTAAWSAATRASLAEHNTDPGTWGAFMLTLRSIGDVAQ